MAQNNQGYGDAVGQDGAAGRSGSDYETAAGGRQSGAMSSGGDMAEMIREDMEVIDAEGNRVGTVDRCEDGQIKLTKADSPDGQHRFIALDQVENVEGGTVTIRGSADEASGRSSY